MPPYDTTRKDCIARLADEEKPTGLHEWAWQAMFASFKWADFTEVWSGVNEYVKWLNSLPMTYERS